ncbi:hypothetical protein EVAR_82885_1 [Eumeta japonica]|uniref:Secreted protein n=1 Tax=Eumeta variegata TaxID=151549 RepID=A0A4C1YLJ4_EUMVA|nr:hypothetical protein EVAR_82885_1 [Eumeta japonica]
MIAINAIILDCIILAITPQTVELGAVPRHDSPHYDSRPYKISSPISSSIETKGNILSDCNRRLGRRRRGGGAHAPVRHYRQLPSALPPHTMSAIRRLVIQDVLIVRGRLF